ncbi:MAG: endonuclease [Bacteroidales bacterium]|nr:endonuclease [Bacteroidales bacterium]
MKKICAVVAALFVAAAGLQAQIFCWNLENYFDPADDPVTADEAFTPGGEHHWTRRKYEAKRNLIAKTIIASAERFGGRMPAIVGLCEVENAKVLKALVEESPLAAQRYRSVHRESPDPRGIDVALLYDPERVRLLGFEFITIAEFATREILYAKVALPDTLHVFVNHWPSKYSGAKASEARRQAVCTALLHKLDSLHRSDSAAAVLLMGDFNATPKEPSVMRLTTEGGLNNITPKKGGTIRFKGKWEMIDQMLASPAAAQKIGPAEVFRPAFLLEDDKSFMGKKPRRTNVGPRYNAGASDHLPIIADIY